MKFDIMDAAHDSDLDEKPPKKGRNDCPMETEDDAVSAALRDGGPGVASGLPGSEGNPKGPVEREDAGDSLAELLKKQFSIMKKDMASMLKTNSEEISTKITVEVSAQVAPIATSVQEIRVAQETQAGEIRELQLQMRGQANASEGGSIAGSSTRASSFLKPFAPHVPTWIQLSGFCKEDPRKIENRDKAKLPVQTARNMISKLYALSHAHDVDDSSIFDKERTEGDLSSNKFGVTRFRIYFKSGTAKDVIWECRKEWSTAWTEKNASLLCQNAFGPYSDQYLGWLVQPAPQDRKRVSETRKATAQFHKRKTISTATVVFEAEGPNKAWMYAKKTSQDENVCIGSWTDSIGWKVSVPKLKDVDPGVDAAVWEGALNSTQ